MLPLNGDIIEIDELNLVVVTVGIMMDTLEDNIQQNHSQENQLM